MNAHITLETVRATLREAFGRDSYVLGCITSVAEDKACPTAGIDRQGRLTYNPAFVKKHVTTQQDLFCLLCHELLHPLFGHFVYSPGKLENLAADSVINASITNLFPHASANGSLFRKFYPDHGLEGLLRPGSDMYQSRYRSLYTALGYEHAYAIRQPGAISTGEVIQALKILTPQHDAAEVLLLGTHGPGGGQDHLSGEALTRLAQAFRQAIEERGGKEAGTGSELFRYLMEVLQTHLSLKKRLLQRYLTDRKLDRFIETIQRPRLSVSPIPIQPSKRDLVLLAAGLPSLHYHNQATHIDTERMGLAVYLDVSGSVNEHLPQIIALLRRLRTELKTIYLFSNKVVEVPFRTLLAGHIQTTFGTDFDCIGQHVLANRLDKAVILTDGYATMKEENREALRKARVQLLVVLFGEKGECRQLEGLGDVVQLAQVTV
jgi:hypothetical protein